VSFDKSAAVNTTEIEKGIAGLGYTIANSEQKTTGRKRIFQNHFQRFLFCLIFTLPLMLHMIGIHIHVLMNAYVQLALNHTRVYCGMDFSQKCYKEFA
jgi:Cu+-exporting ATPase